MAFDTRDWRKLVLGDRVFYWQADEALGWEVFRVRPEQQPHRLLRVKGGWCGHHFGLIGRVNPANVRATIECAVEHSWLEEQPNLRLFAFDAPAVEGRPTILRYVGRKSSWLTPTVIALTKGVESQQAYDRLPILSDALEEAGCDDPDVLSHCRRGGPHVRGCWVVDLILGES
jgi:hypothetical protein